MKSMHKSQAFLVGLVALLASSEGQSDVPAKVLFVCGPLDGHSYTHREPKPAADWELLKDGYALYVPNVIIRKNGNARLDLIPNHEGVKAGVGKESSELKNLVGDLDHFAFVGVERGAPIMVSLFFKSGLLVYSRNRVNMIRGGINTDVFFADCQRKM